MSFVVRFSNPLRFALLLASVWGAGVFRPDGAHAQLSPAFTYQGQLQQSGMPENATACDFRFSLFAAAGGTALGTQAVNSVSVTNGLFTVVLNDSNQLGASAFSGSNRYLEVDVCCPAGCAPSYVTLSPRQQLTATPYALYAPAAGSAGGLSCSGCVSSADLAAGAVTSSAIASGAIQPSNLGFTPVLSVGATAPLASSGGQSPTLSLTGTVAVANGGTGASTAVGARGNLAAAMRGANADITSLSGITGNITLPESTSETAGNILKGGTPFIHDYPGSASGNTFVGENAGNFLLSGSYNTALGAAALAKDSGGYNNTAVGFNALMANASGADDTAVGNSALSSNTADGNTALGSQTLASNTSGYQNTAVGELALEDNTIAGANVAMGVAALEFNSDGTNNTAVGFLALQSNTGNATCTSPGVPLSCCTGSGQGSCGSWNTAVGSTSLRSNTTGTNNTAVGQSALQANTTGNGNAALGQGALAANSDASDNTAVGFLALESNAGNATCTDAGTPLQCCSGAGTGTCGSYNAALGQAALQANTTGANNTAVGQSALVTNTVGQRNTALGVNALQSNTTASGNTAVGAHALYDNDSDRSGTAINNTAVGLNALYGNLTGTNNIAIGFGAGSKVVKGNNGIYIGTVGPGDESNTIRIGDPSINQSSSLPARTFIAGINGATSGGGVNVFINSSGQLGTATSSVRYKEQIHDMGNSSSGLMQLRPVRFRYKKAIDPSGLEQYGLVAEEVAKVYPDLVVYNDKGQPETVRYHFINAMLLNEVQKQARQIAALKQQVEELAKVKAATAALQARLDALETQQPLATGCSIRAEDVGAAAF